MTKQGMVDRGRPSMRELARRANLSVETVRRTVFGLAKPEVETIDALAKALTVKPSTVSSWVDVVRLTDEPWAPPAEAALLSPKVRKALDQLIYAMTESEASSDAAPTTGAVARESGPSTGNKARRVRTQSNVH
jgi:transcriptional regulator with XRE-family HTH domain